MTTVPTAAVSPTIQFPRQDKHASQLSGNSDELLQGSATDPSPAEVRAGEQSVTNSIVTPRHPNKLLMTIVCGGKRGQDAKKDGIVKPNELFKQKVKGISRTAQVHVLNSRRSMQPRHGAGPGPNALPLRLPKPIKSVSTSINTGRAHYAE